MAPADRPEPSSAAISAFMRRMPRRDTGPEIALRSSLHRLGLRFRVNHPGLPGRPDIAFTRARIAVFVDGCFWHSCPEHFVPPKSNSAWWQKKLDSNVERDRRKDRELAEQGWTAVHVWEHEDPSEAAERIRDLWHSRKQQHPDTP